MKVYQQILQAYKNNRKEIAVLLDPDKIAVNKLPEILKKINSAPVDYIFLGGSIVENVDVNDLVRTIKKHTVLPVVIFPGHPSQISDEADALLFLSLLSGRNSEYLIEHHINAIDALENSDLEIISTGYILIDGGKESAVQRVTNTKPIMQDQLELAYKTAKAGEYLGKKLVYLEAGSGALHSVSEDLISYLRKRLNLPIIVGGGIRSFENIKKTHRAGADLVVIGTAFENNEDFFN
jgi:phosphoglycerol geranylgeranyltransferase